MEGRAYCGCGRRDRKKGVVYGNTRRTACKRTQCLYTNVRIRLVENVFVYAFLLQRGQIPPCFDTACSSLD